MTVHDRFCTSLCRVVSLAALCVSGAAIAGSLGGRLELEDEGSFFVNGQVVTSSHPGASLVTGPAALPTLFLGTHERAWVNFRFGPAYAVPFPNLQFPLGALDQYFAQLVPNSETTLAGAGANTVNALAALLDRIGPAVVMVHSQS